MILQSKHIAKLAILVAFTVLIALSCKKEYIQIPYNDIERFSINDGTGTELKAVLKGNDILIYWPPFQTTPDSIVPQITISAAAAISPESQHKIPFKDGFQYLVKAQNGSTKTYQLKIANSQPIPYFDFNGTMSLNENAAIAGDYFIPDTNKTTFYLVDKNLVETKLTAIHLTNSIMHFNVPLKLSQDTGFYQIKLVTGSRTLTKGPYYVTRPVLTFPNMTLPASLTTVKRGETIRFQFSNSNIKEILKYYNTGTSYAEVSITNRIAQNVSILEITDTEIAIKIPSDFPLGRTYGRVLFFFENSKKGSWIRTATPFTIIE